MEFCHWVLEYLQHINFSGFMPFWSECLPLYELNDYLFIIYLYLIQKLIFLFTEWLSSLSWNLFKSCDLIFFTNFFPTLEKLLNKLIIKVDVDDVDVYIDNWTSFY